MNKYNRFYDMIFKLLDWNMDRIPFDYIRNQMLNKIRSRDAQDF